MKTAISVPDRTFHAASRRAEELGMSRSEFFSRAAEHYLAELDAASVTARIDASLGATGDDRDDDGTRTAAVRAGRRTVSQSEW